MTQRLSHILPVAALLMVLLPLDLHAVTSNTWWNVKTTATAGNVNGGGFTHGVGAKDVTGATDLVVDGTTNTLVTSATHTFVAGDVGKFINITAGVNWNLGYYQIASISGSGAVLNRAPSVIGQTGGTYDLYAGVDQSMTDAATQAYTDLVIGTPNTTGTSATRPFVAGDVGNLVNVISGTNCTVQRVAVNSVAAGVATFDAALGTIGSTCTANLGGSLLTIAAAMALTTITNQYIWIQSGTYVTTTTIAIPNNVSAVIIGYQAAHFDMGTKPLITTATDSTNLFNTTDAGYPTAFVNVSLSNTASVRAYGITSSGGGSFPGVIVSDSVLDGFTSGINMFTAARAGNVFVFGTEIKNCSTHGIEASQDLVVVDSYVHNNTGTGIFHHGNANQRLIVMRTISANNGAHGFYADLTSPQLMIYSNTFAGNGASGATLTGLNYGSGGNLPLQILNNIFYGNGTFGFKNDGAAPAWLNIAAVLGPNAYGANTSGNTSGFPQSIGKFDIQLGASPFTSATDYSLNNTANGGKLLQKAGYPGVFPGGLSTGYLDVGAVQTSGSTTSAGTRTY